MGLRDLLVIVLVFGSLPLILWRPYLGILVWSWISYMNPHRLAFGIAYSMPLAQVVAITLLVAVLFARDISKPPLTKVTALWALFLVWMVITSQLALYPDMAQVQLIKVLKIHLITALTLVLINTRQKLDHLIWVIVLSIGFFSTKGGVFTLLTGGGYRVYGPPSSFIYENNGLAVATLMVIPLMLYLHQLSRKKWLRLVLVAMMALSMVSVLGSHSRGALLAIGAVGFFFWLKTKGKLLSTLAMVTFAALLFNFMPQSWHDRMNSIANYQQDKSAMGRINAWGYSINVASDRITGAGFESWTPQAFRAYAPDPDNVHAAHSIYFAVLGDHGWPGLIIFGSILLLTWNHLRAVERQAKRRPGAEDDLLLARCLQISLIAYMSGGAFLSLAYFDLPWHLIAITIILRQLNWSSAEGVAMGAVPAQSAGMQRHGHR